MLNEKLVQTDKLLSVYLVIKVQVKLLCVDHPKISMFVELKSLDTLKFKKNVELDYRKKWFWADFYSTVTKLKNTSDREYAFNGVTTLEVLPVGW